MKLSPADIALLKIVAAAPVEDGRLGWREIPAETWPLVEAFPHHDLIHPWAAAHKVRLTNAGKAVLEYLL